MAQLNDKNTRRVVLCGSDTYCPEVLVSHKEILITDDFGGKVKLTHEQFGILKEKISQGEL